MKKTLNLLDLVDKETLDEILDAFNEVCGIGSVIADVEGRPLSGEQNFTRFCAKYCRGTEDGRKKCYASDAFGGEMSLKQQEPYVYNCLNSGLVDCATPIIVEGYHLANLNGGQVLEEPIPKEVAIARAKAIGIEDIDGYLEDLDRIPFVTKPKLQKIVKFMAVITRTLSDMAMQKYLLAKQSKEYLNKLVDSVSDCIFAIDVNFRITMVNKICHDAFGFEDGRFTAKTSVIFWTRRKRFWNAKANWIRVKKIISVWRWKASVVTAASFPLRSRSPGSMMKVVRLPATWPFCAILPKRNGMKK